MTVEYLDLTDYVAIATEVTGLDLDTILKVTDLNLADSALHAPAAGFGDTDFYPEFVDKAAVLMSASSATIRCPRATSEPGGCHYGCSSR